MLMTTIMWAGGAAVAVAIGVAGWRSRASTKPCKPSGTKCGTPAVYSQMFYAMAEVEIERGVQQPSLWSKAIAIGGEDKETVKRAYARLLEDRFFDDPR